jgi:hypothetical protein
MKLGEVRRLNSTPAAGWRRIQVLRGHFFTGK